MTAFVRYVLRSLLLGMLAAAIAVAGIVFVTTPAFARAQSEYVFVALVLGGASLWLFNKFGHALVFAGAGVQTLFSIAGGLIFGDVVFTFYCQTIMAVLWLVALIVVTAIKPKVVLFVTSEQQARQILVTWIRAVGYAQEIQLTAVGDGPSQDGFYDFKLNTGGRVPWDLSVSSYDGSVVDLWNFAGQMGLHRND